jgi:hypothetical protein
MKKVFAIALAGAFAASTLFPSFGLAQDQKKEQVHKGTPAQGTVQKKEHQKASKRTAPARQKPPTRNSRSTLRHKARLRPCLFLFRAPAFFVSLCNDR